MEILRTRKTQFWVFMLIGALLVPGMSLLASSLNADENEKLSLEMATLFRAARKVISVNQALINDADKGDKGLSGPEVVEFTRKN